MDNFNTRGVTDLQTRKQVNFDQLKALIEFLKEHPDLAKGLARGRRGKLQSFRLWNLCAKNLNAVKDGAVKDGKGWSKYWCDWKYRVRRRTLELKAARDSNRPPPDGVTPLSHLEEDILSIIGENSLENVIIKFDPLGNENPNDIESVLLNQSRSRPTGNRKRTHSSSEDDPHDHEGNNSPVGREAEVNKHEDPFDKGLDHETSQFIALEREKIKNSKKMHECMETISSEITRLADVMSHIRDILTNK